MRKRALFGLAVLASLFLLSACKDNPHDNTRLPDPYPVNAVKTHRFDGGATDPYYDPSDKGDKGGDAPAPKGD